MFTQSCFIRKNTPELRKKLEELGYTPNYTIGKYPEAFKNIAACNFFEPHYYGVSEEEASRPGDIEDAIKNRGLIDCGTNEELFLALAALRDDSNMWQWYICVEDVVDIDEDDGEILNLCDVGDWLIYDCDYIENNIVEENPTSFRKATVEEIIEHFSK